MTEKEYVETTIEHYKVTKEKCEEILKILKDDGFDKSTLLKNKDTLKLIEFAISSYMMETSKHLEQSILLLREFD